MKDRLLTLDNLYEFYSTHKKSCHFSAEESGEPIVVQTPGKLKFKKEEISEGLSPVVLHSCHTGTNLNRSSISKEVMENKFLPTFKNRPILGYIHNVDGEPNFQGHNMHEDEEGELVYEEIPVGIIPEGNNAKLEYDEAEDHYDVIVEGFIFDDYTQAKNIIEREGECSVSVEIAIKDFSYSAKDKVLIINDGFFSGVTILGKNPDGSEVLPGMKGSNIKFKDFSMENNSVFSELEENKLIETLDKLNDTLSKFNIQAFAEENSEKGGQNKMFEELLEKYGKTLEDVTFEYENLSDEELEIAFSEAFSEEITETESVETETETVVEETESVTEETETVEITETESTVEEDVVTTEAESVETPVEYSVEFSATCGEITKTYSVSLNDKIYALQELINDTYAEDGDWYSVEVFEDTKTVVFHGWMKSYRQTYKVKNDVYSLVGDRVEIHPVWMTDEEESKFEAMKSNYSAIESELSTYKLAEEKADKLSIFEDEDYAQFLETDEFKSLMSDDSILANTKEELTDKAELAFAKLVKTAGTYTKQAKTENKPDTTFVAFAKVEENDFFANLLNKKN